MYDGKGRTGDMTEHRRTIEYVDKSGQIYIYNKMRINSGEPSIISRQTEKDAMKKCTLRRTEREINALKCNRKRNTNRR